MSELDRLSIRSRPVGRPVMHQTWGKLLFMHWRIPADRMRPHVPSGLELDLWEGEAWVGVTPFTMWDIRPPYLPAVPLLSESHELNVRTYVHSRGVPGVWFLSLDAANPLAVLGARLGFHLPYFQARMSLTETDGTVRFTSTRIHPGAPRASFDATWSAGADLPPAEPDSLEFFLTERYCLYAEHDRVLSRARIWHRPWPLRSATLHTWSSTMLESHGLPVMTDPPLLHAADRLDVEVWAPERVGVAP